MIVVSDTSAITNLIKIDHLWLLKELYQQYYYSSGGAQ